MNNVFFFLLFSLISYPILGINRATVPSAGAAPTPNGSFENPVITSSNGFIYHPTNSGWHSYVGGFGFVKNNMGHSNGNATTSGNQALFLQGNCSGSTTINIAQAGYYRFTFKGALRANFGQQSKRVKISVSGYQIAETPLTSYSYQNYESPAVYLTAGSHTLTLEGVNVTAGDHTGLVDDLRIQQLLDWNDPYTWGGSLPNVNDIATISSNSNVVMSGNINVNRVVVNGHLLAAQNRDINLSAKNVLIMGSRALLEIGQNNSPYNSNATITLTANPNDAPIMNMGNKFVGAMNGGELRLHGQSKKSWSNLEGNVNPGTNQITMKESVDWKIGDQILIVPSSTNYWEAEKRVITAISNNSRTLTLNSSLAYPHKGVVKSYSRGNQTWTADLRAEVGVLTHNIKIQGNAQSAVTHFGGHIMIMNNASAYVDGIELYNMGQKSILGRYPFHWHMLGSNGAGQYFRNSSVHQSYNRAITIHGTESTLVENNFCYDHIGHGLFLEDGSERFNVIRRNVVLGTKRPAPGEEVTPSDNQIVTIQNMTPSSYWITNPENTFEENVAAGTHGTGYWFAFPKQPMGASTNDPRFASLKPNEAPLISFTRNIAHSCSNGIDIFDGLTNDHSIVFNEGWVNNGTHWIENCLFYGNTVALYTGTGEGGPTSNLIFNNTILVDNRHFMMFASNSIVNQSVFVANSGENLYSGERYLSLLYDGPGQVWNSHFVGWNASNANLLDNFGGATKHANHIFGGSNTKDHNGFVRCSLPNYNLVPASPVGDPTSDPRHPRNWLVSVKDYTGAITGQANTTIVCNHPFMLVGDEYQPSNWTNAYVSSHQFFHATMAYDLPVSQFPNVHITRRKQGLADSYLYLFPNGSFKEHPQHHVIANEGFEYIYTYEQLPTSKTLRLFIKDATMGDHYIARYKNFGNLSGLSVYTTQGSITPHSSLASLYASPNAGYYIEPGGDLYLKAVALESRNDRQFVLQWTSDMNFTPSIIDTDGDQMSDLVESSTGRHPWDASDLHAGFETTGNFEGWNEIYNLSGGNVTNGSLNGIAMGDAQIVNRDYNFAAAAVPKLYIRFQAAQNGWMQLFFNNGQGFFSGSRVVNVYYSGNGAPQTLEFNMANHPDWQGWITELRLDPLTGNNQWFNIQYISASTSNTQLQVASSSQSTIVTEKDKLLSNTLIEPVLESNPSTEITLFPNPVDHTLFIRGVNDNSLIEIYDSAGKSIQKQIKSNAIDVHQLSPGIYFIRKGEQSYQFVKK
ncbi:MAG: T9SS type A sorting domain-containing protein [Saprospiraceae bacterium]|nr:T9SS type A sorting domain-containing protein [Saprospiraceae bacterium]